jgi:ankyrin repeat protein
MLLEAGARAERPGRGGFSPLGWAARRGDVELVRLLIKRGAQVDAADEHGQTALMDAVMANQVETARVLLEAGADPNAPGMGLPPMAFAVTLGGREMVKLLTEFGATGRSSKSGVSAEVLPGAQEDPEIAGMLKAASGVD